MNEACDCGKPIGWEIQRRNGARDSVCFDCAIADGGEFRAVPARGGLGKSCLIHLAGAVMIIGLAWGVLALWGCGLERNL